MTDVSSILFDVVSQYSHALENGPDDELGLDSGDQTSQRYAPATWLDALNMDERSRPEEHIFAPRLPAPSDEAGLYAMFLKPIDC